jgi:hypothetical protein
MTLHGKGVVMDIKWHKYTFACDPDECDTLIEYTVRDDRGIPNVMNITCPCGRDLLLLSVEDATINNNNEQKEDSPMHATTEFLERQAVALQELITKKDEYITRLQDEVSKNSQLVYTVRAEMNNFRNSVKEYVVEALSERDMTNEVAETLANLLDFELTKTVTVTATVDFELELEVPFDVDADDVANSIEFSADSFDYSIDDFSLDVQSLQASDNIS